MQSFDHNYAEELILRLSSHPGVRGADLQNTGGSLAHHFCVTLQYSRGLGPVLPDSSTWLSRSVLKPLVLSRILPIVEIFGQNALLPRPEKHDDKADLSRLANELEIYLSLVQADEFVPVPHPKLGPFGIDDWARWHVAHFEHHLKQLSRGTEGALSHSKAC